MSETEVKKDDAEEPKPIEPETMAEEADLAARLAEAEAKAQENWDLLLRAKADLDNQRRRTEREVEKAHKYALERFTQELLPVIDSLEMGVDAANAEGATLAKVCEGTELTLKMLLSTIDKFGIQAVHPEGEPFNPEFHQAMSMLESPEHAPNTVMNVMQKGYTLNERLIRPAMVVVAKAPAAEQEEKDEDSKGVNIDEQA